MATTESYDIPKECWAGVVKNEGPGTYHSNVQYKLTVPDFEIDVKKVPVPEIGMI